LDPWGRWPISGANTPSQWKAMLRAYLAATSFTDWTVGQVLKALADSPYAKNTIVVFWSDNGYHCGEKNHWEKGALWEQTTRTPLAIRLPGQSSAQLIIQPVSLVDLYPTLLDICNLETPKHQLGGSSLQALLLGDQISHEKPILTTLGPERYSLRTKKYRFIHYEDGSEELYDLNKDPYEFDNLLLGMGADSLLVYFRQLAPKSWAPALSGRPY
ncbi:MAG: sulfatase-like hydrolase/transferase, partial [Bacteroidota bacterium]